MHILRKPFLHASIVVTCSLLGSASISALPPGIHDESLVVILASEPHPLPQGAQAQLTVLQNHLQAARGHGDTRAEADDLKAIGLLNYTNGRFDDALDAFWNALPLYRGLANQQSEAEVLMEMGSAFSALGMQEKALEHYKQALPIWNRLDLAREAATLGKIGEIFRALNDPQEALDFSRAALPIFVQLGDRAGQAAALNNIGLAWFASGNKRKAIDLFQAQTVYHAIADLSGEATALNNAAVVYNSMGNSQKSLEAFHQALELQQQRGDKRAAAATLDSMGIVYLAKGNSLKAHQTYAQALSMYREAGDRDGEARMLNNLNRTDLKRDACKAKPTLRGTPKVLPSLATAAIH